VFFDLTEQPPGGENLTLGSSSSFSNVGSQSREIQVVEGLTFGDLEKNPLLTKIIQISMNKMLLIIVKFTKSE
jgi:hypothetical protein